MKIDCVTTPKGLIKQDWEVKIINDNPTFPFIVIDNWYNEAEEKAVWKELDFLSSYNTILRAENTIVARNSDGSPRSKAFRWYHSELFNNTEMYPEGVSNIKRFQYKQKTKEFHNFMGQCLPYGRSFLSTNRDSTMLSYYEEDDHYDAHHDTFAWTQCTWFVREPRLFTGGDFDFPESGFEVKLKHNRTVFFPCCFLHRVSPVKFHTQPSNIGFGRYTITHFYYSIPGE